MIWFKKRAAQPEWFFEIEHTTPIYSGLLRLNDVKIDYPLPRATIVSSPEKRSLYENQIRRRTFEFSELADVCRFMDYRDVEKWFESKKTIEEIKRHY